MIKAVTLGILQGLTEFLPVSSSGHLVLAQDLLGMDAPGITFEVVLHVGTLLAVLAVYGRDLVGITRGVLGWDTTFRTRESRRLALWIILGSVPAALVGIGLKSHIEVLFNSVLAVGMALIMTGFILWASGGKTKGNRQVASLGPLGAVWIGLAQAAAILPGISRSGATVSAGFHLGLKPPEAARFSFLLSVPAVAGAALVDALDAPWDGFSASFLLAGALSASLTGYAAIRVLLWVLARGRLRAFSYYCFALGLLAITWHFAGA
jgi:undecaprenyl-diphosphatase